MEVLSYAAHTSVNGAKDFLAKLRTFAVSVGWTSVDYQTSVTWATIGSPNFGWVAGTRDFLELNSAGYGSQTLRYRFATTIVTGGTNLIWGPVTPGELVDTHDSTSPEVTHVWTNNILNVNSMPTSTFPACWFFGNSHCIWCVAQVSATCVQVWGFGSPTFVPELQTTTDGQGQWWCCQSGGAAFTWLWSAMETNPSLWACGLGVAPFAFNSYPMFWWLGAPRYALHYASNYYLAADVVQPHLGNFCTGAYQIVYNAYADQRTVFEPTIWLCNAGGLWEPSATLPGGFIVFAGLAVGDILTYGTEQYIAFPLILSSSTYGCVFRIA